MVTIYHNPQWSKSRKSVEILNELGVNFKIIEYIKSGFTINEIKSISKKLKLKLVNTNIRRFADGEIYIEINENIRGNSVFVIQSTSNPANDNLMELLLVIDALRRSSAKNVTAVIPYFGYARQDRRVRSARVPITAKVVADFLSNVGVDRVLTVDLHAEQIQGFFACPVDNVYASPVLNEDIVKCNYDNPIVVSPDIGGVVRARAIAKQLDDAELAIIDKRRPQANESQVMNLIGDVKNKTCIIVDDIIDSGGTIVHAVDALKKKGAKEVFVFITHAVLSGDAAKKIKNSKIKKLIITDTIDNSQKIKNNNKIEVLSIASLMSEAIKRIANSNSVSDLFN